MTTATVSASVDAQTKTIANAYIQKAGLTPNEVIRNLWEHIAATGEVPKIDDAERIVQERRMQAFREAVALSETIPADNPLVTMTDREIKEMARNRDI